MPTLGWTLPADTRGDAHRRKLAATWQTGVAVYIGRGTGVRIVDAGTGKVSGTRHAVARSPGLLPLLPRE
ncbi:hypothetical protein ACU686_05700 [Yinghuangia aomiensis]